MKLKTFFVLLLAALWGVGSWWWYTCKIKSYCAESSALSALIGTGISTLSAKLNGETTNDISVQNATTNQATSTDTVDNGNGESTKPDPVEDAADTATDSDTTQANTTSENPAPDTSKDTQTESESGTVNLNESANNATTQDAEEKADPGSTTVETTEKDAVEADNSTSENTEQSAVATENQAETNAATETVESDDASSKEPPAIPEDKTDSDNDGITDIMENKLTTDPGNPDSDGDGLTDLVELGDNLLQPLDSDNDGAIDAQDEDDDNDGDLTIDEAADPDKNGLPDDARDYDQDGTPDYLDKDTNYASRDDDGDGLLNGEEKRLGTNPTLTDSDGDGLSDKFEAVDEKDSDNDGTIDALDPDDDDDGVMTVMESADPDGDGNPEDAIDSNDNNKPDYLDTDNTPTELPKDPPEETQEKTVEAAVAIKASDSDTTQQETKTVDNSPAVSEDQETEEEATAEKNDASDSDSATNDTQETEQKTDTEEATDNSNKVTVDTGDAEQGDSNEIRTAKLYFPFRSAEPELSESAASYFDLVIKQLEDNPGVKIKLTGHTDSVGRGAANRKLGLKRAEQVRDMLTKRGAPEKQIEVESAGESEPVADNKLEAGREKNRRVELEQIK